MKINRYSWNKKILKLNRRLTKFSNAISLIDRSSRQKFLEIIEVFEKMLWDWRVEIFNNNNSTSMIFPSQNTGSDVTWYDWIPPDERLEGIKKGEMYMGEDEDDIKDE